HPFVAVNCAALPEALVETELFGIEKGVATGVDRRIGKFEAAHEGTIFREDLYYRLSVVNIQTPSLRETPEDIPILANHFLQKHCATLALEPKQLSPEALERLCAYRWPGNARQLENEIKRLVASVRGRIISEEHIAIPAEPKTAPPASGATPAAGQSLSEAVEALERRLIQEALQQAGGNKLKAAQILGMSRGGFLKKLKKLSRAGEA